MNGNGFIKIHRELFKHPIWLNSTAQQKVILIALIEMVNHKPNKWEWNGEQFEVKRGQKVTSLESICAECGKGITIQNVRTALARFEKLGFLTNESTKTGRLITICNYCKWQDNDEETNKEDNKELTDTSQRPNKDLTPNKNDKNDKKIINNISSNKLSDEFDELWEIYPRKEGKKKAKDAYIRARKNGTSFEDVMNGIRNYQNHIEQTGIDRKYIKMGSTYFNGRCWEDRFETSDPVDDWLERWGNDEE